MKPTREIHWPRQAVEFKSGFARNFPFAFPYDWLMFDSGFGPLVPESPLDQDKLICQSKCMGASQG